MSSSLLQFTGATFKHVAVKQLDKKYLAKGKKKKQKLNLFHKGLFNGKYKRSAGLEALHFQFDVMFVNIQFAQI